MSLILATIFSAALAQTSPSQPPPPQPVATAATETKTQGRHVDKHKKNDPKKDNPDPALLGFLGDYEDAADGLDPIGLSEQAESDKPKDGRGP